jgi:hypothetical protein
MMIYEQKQKKLIAKFLNLLQFFTKKLIQADKTVADKNRRGVTQTTTDLPLVSVRRYARCRN